MPLNQKKIFKNSLKWVLIFEFTLVVVFVFAYSDFNGQFKVRVEYFKWLFEAGHESVVVVNAE